MRILFSVIMVVMAIVSFTGCGGSDGGSSSTPASSITAPASLEGMDMSFTVTSGSGVLSTNGTGVLSLNTGGTYVLTALTGDVSSGVGTSSYSAVGNVGTAVMQDTTRNLTTTYTLTFSSSTVGVFNGVSGSSTHTGTFTLAAQGTAPASLENMDMSFTATSGSGVLAANGTGVLAINAGGAYVLTALTGDVSGGAGTSSYSAVGNVGTAVMQDTTRNLTITYTLTFSSSTAGIFSGVSGSSTHTGTFTLAAQNALINANN